jgi:3-oxoacyl-[acyl-carrier protein] reductase
MALPFSGRRALVIGGTGGIGRAMCLGLAARGAGITVTGGNSPEKLESLLDELGRLRPAAASDLPRCKGFLCTIGGGGLSPEQASEFILSKEQEPDILMRLGAF